MTTLHEQQDEFADRNQFLFLALGALSYARKLDRLLPGQARPAAAGNNGTGDRQDRHRAALVDFLLGLIAVRNRVDRLLQEAAASGSRVGPPAREPRLQGRGWLR